MVSLRGRTVIEVLLVLIIATNFRIMGQSRSVVSLPDNSDWWSITKSDCGAHGTTIQHQKIEEANLRIAEIDLRNMTFDRVNRVLGKTPIVQRGDASSWREQACYQSESEGRPVYLIFEHGEVNSAFYLFSQDIPWRGRTQCTPSKMVSPSIRTASGLHLGQTPNQIIEILGEPSKRRENEFTYFIETNEPTPSDALVRARKQHPELSEKQFREDFASLDVIILIRATFAHSRLIYLGVSISETS